MGDKAVALARVAVGKVSGDQPGSATKRDPSCSSNCASSDTGKVDGGDGHDQSGGAGAGGIHKEKSGSDAGGELKFACYMWEGYTTAHVWGGVTAYLVRLHRSTLAYFSHTHIHARIR